MQDKFTKMVKSSTHLTKRHDSLLKEVKARALSLGVRLSDDDVIQSVEFRTAVYGSHDPDFDQIIANLEHIPAVVEWRAVQRLVERLEAGDPDAADEIGGTPVEKMIFARENGLTGHAKIDAKMTDEQIAEIRDPSRRVAAYRAKHQQVNENIQQDPNFMSPAMKMAHARKIAKGAAT
ncbi:MAG: hypothetical protein AAF871_13085 [Pseudomonadota bacterium]